MIEYCRYHVEASKKGADDKPAKSEDDVKQWDTEFVKVDQATLFDLILVGGCKGLVGGGACSLATVRGARGRARGGAPCAHLRTLCRQGGFSGHLRGARSALLPAPCRPPFPCTFPDTPS